MTNSHHYYHTNDRRGTGRGKGKDNRGSRSSRHDTSQASWYVFFFFFLNFIYYMFICTQNYLDDNNQPLPLHTISIPRMNTGSRCRCISSSDMLIFFLSTTNDYIFLDCVYGTTTRMTTANSHHLWDDKQGLETQHLSLESLVCFFIFLDMFLIFSFFIIVSTYLDVSTTTNTTLSNGSSCLKCR